MSLKGSFTSVSPLHYVTVGKIFIILFNDYKTGVRFAYHGLMLSEKYHCKSSQTGTAIVAYMFVLSWIKPFQTLWRPLADVDETGMLAGDTEGAMWVSQQHRLFLLFSLFVKFFVCLTQCFKFLLRSAYVHIYGLEWNQEGRWNY